MSLRQGPPVLVILFHKVVSLAEDFCHAAILLVGSLPSVFILGYLTPRSSRRIQPVVG